MTGPGDKRKQFWRGFVAVFVAVCRDFAHGLHNNNHIIKIKYLMINVKKLLTNVKRRCIMVT